MLSRRLIRVKTVKSLYSHLQSGEESLIKSEREYQGSLRKCYELYLLMLELIVEVADHAERRIELAQGKMMPTEQDLNPNRRFVDNSIIELIRQSDKLTDASIRHKLSWNGHEPLIKSLYQNMLASDYFVKYMEQPTISFADERRLLVDFYKRHIEENPAIEEALEEMSIFWTDDTGFALGFVIQTINALNKQDADLDLLPIFKNEDDREYAETLFRKAIVNKREYFEYIEAQTKNWDFERIAFMDKVIMLAAVSELTQFPSIPVKVTLDEFIEIAKYYSTSSSGLFINGILDKLVERLQEEQKIIKTGRGLIDSSIEKESKN